MLSKSKYNNREMITFTINNKLHECVDLIPVKCRLLYEGSTSNYYLLVDRALYKAENDDGGVLHFEYLEEIDVEPGL